MNILFFDTETTGKPRNYKAPATDVDNWPRLIQLGFEVWDSDGYQVEKYLNLIQPDGWEVPKEDFFINHNLTTERCQEEGVPVVDALLAFMDAIKNNDVALLVAHNMQFDQPIVAAEMIRREMRLERIVAKFCTMKASVDLCAIPGPYGYKWPKLEELHRKLFDKDFANAHDAGNDVAALRNCFFELMKLGHINPESIVKEVAR